MTTQTNFHVIEDILLQTNLLISIFRKRIKLFQNLMSSKNTEGVRQDMEVLKTVNEGTVIDDSVAPME